MCRSICSGDNRLQRVDAGADTINRGFGRGTVTAAASLASKMSLDHKRIAFGKPHEVM